MGATIYQIPGEKDCPHPETEVAYLGQMGTNAFYQCDHCDSVLVAG